MILDRGLQFWLPTYVAGMIRRRRLRRFRRRHLTHVLFLVCDHFEPAHEVSGPEQAGARLRAWHEGYAAMQAQVFNRSGLRPVHTWFYPPHHGFEHLPALARMAFDGLGEVELHYHHEGDTEASLRAKLAEDIMRFQSAGLLLQAGSPPRRCFGFIHGDWALDNSANGEFCGVNSELSLLQELGCWADLTMPSANGAQTRKINSIYYAVDDPTRPKSHDWGVNAARGVTDRPGLLLIQGPLAVNLGAPGYPRIENASLTTENWGRPDRIRKWLDCHVHVEGRPEWIFIKLHTHGAIERDWSALFGEHALRMHWSLCDQLNSGMSRLHYVTARQACNVIRAAEAGAEGDPSQYFDFAIPPQTTSLYCLDRPHRLSVCTPQRLELEVDETTECTIRLRSAAVRGINGPVRGLTWLPDSGVLEIRTSLPGIVRVETDPRVRLSAGNATILPTSEPGWHEVRGTGLIRLRAELL